MSPDRIARAREVLALRRTWRRTGLPPFRSSLPVPQPRQPNADELAERMLNTGEIAAIRDFPEVPRG